MPPAGYPLAGVMWREAVNTYPSTALRNIGLFAHSGAGKTSLAEALLFASGAIPRLGRVDEGTTTSDFEPDEIQHKISLSATVLPCEWRGTKVNVIDTPGYADFVGEVCSALSVVDSALLVVCGASGVEVGTAQCWERARTRGLPVAVFVNKLDRERADFARALSQIKARFPHAVALQLPIGQEAGLTGVVDLLSGKASIVEGVVEREDVPPATMAADIASAREALVEAICESDAELTDRYLEGESIDEGDLCAALRRAVQAGTLVPVLCGSALLQVGMRPLLDFMAGYLPDPLHGMMPRTEEGAPMNGSTAAFVFKTVVDPFGKLSLFRLYGGTLHGDAHLYNPRNNHDERLAHLLVVRGKAHEEVRELAMGDIGAALKLADVTTGDTLTVKDHPVKLAPIAFPDTSYSAALEANSRADLDKLGPAMSRLTQEDPTLHWYRDPETAETIISGMGESHLQVAVERLHRKFGTDVHLGEPKVPYHETISTSAKAQGRHKRQTGGHGQFGDVWLEVEPLPRGSGYRFVDKIVGGVVPRQYIPAVDKGVQEVLHQGPLTGNPLVDIQVTLYDGSFHPVDSSEMAFKTAAAIGFRAAIERAHPILLEPIMEVQVLAPSELMGDVVGDLNSKRARILGMDGVPSGSGDGMTQITAHVPMAELFRYATTLRSLTQGRASYTMHMMGYEETPTHIAQQVAAAHHAAAK